MENCQGFDDTKLFGFVWHGRPIYTQLIVVSFAARRIEGYCRRRNLARRTAGRGARRPITGRCGSCPWPGPARWCRRHGCARPRRHAPGWLQRAASVLRRRRRPNQPASRRRARCLGMTVVLARHPGDARHASQAFLNDRQFLSRGPTPPPLRTGKNLSCHHLCPITCKSMGKRSHV